MGLPVFLKGPRYVLGETEADFSTIDNLHARAEEFRMALDPALWGWGSVFRSQRGLEAMGEYETLAMGQPLVIDPPHPIDDANVSSLGEKNVVVDEAPDREQRVHAARVGVVPKNTADPHHARISTSARSCLPGS